MSLRAKRSVPSTSAAAPTEPTAVARKARRESGAGAMLREKYTRPFRPSPGFLRKLQGDTLPRVTSDREGLDREGGGE